MEVYANAYESGDKLRKKTEVLATTGSRSIHVEQYSIDWGGIYGHGPLHLE